MGDTIGYVETTYVRGWSASAGPFTDTFTCSMRQRIRTPIKAPCDGIIQQAEFEQGEMIEEGDGLFVIQPREDDGTAGAWGSNRCESRHGPVCMSVPERCDGWEPLNSIATKERRRCAVSITCPGVIADAPSLNR